MITLHDLIANTDLLSKAFDIITDQTYSFNGGDISMRELGFEFFTITVAECDLRNEYLNSRFATYCRSRHANIYAYSNFLREELLTDRQKEILKRSYDNLGTVRIRVRLIIDTERPAKTSLENVKSELFSFETIVILSDYYIVPREQHFPFPRKDNYENWIFDFVKVGSLTKGAR